MKTSLYEANFSDQQYTIGLHGKYLQRAVTEKMYTLLFSVQSGVEVRLQVMKKFTKGIIQLMILYFQFYFDCFFSLFSMTFHAFDRFVKKLLALLKFGLCLITLVICKIGDSMEFRQIFFVQNKVSCVIRVLAKNTFMGDAPVSDKISDLEFGKFVCSLFPISSIRHYFNIPHGVFLRLPLKHCSSGSLSNRIR